ncbi:MAG TPA: alpha/beta hydrolase [Stellaceae bacterium]|nr:alpha/beta hydrolase [Stellaceae bacterium]
MELIVEGKRVFAGTGGRPFDPDLPAAVFLHGAGMDHTVWALQTRAIAHRGRSVLALDLPGHGASDGPALESIEAMADWVLAVLDAADAPGARIAGHSMGSLVALETARRGASRIDALALLGFVPEMSVHPDLTAAARSGAHAALDLITSWGLAMRSQLGHNLAPGLWLQGETLRLLERASNIGLASDLAACAAYKGAAAAAAAIRCPTLFLLGAEDRMTPAAKGKAFAETIPGATVTVLPGVGHMMMIEDPAGTLAALKSAM